MGMRLGFEKRKKKENVSPDELGKDTYHLNILMLLIEPDRFVVKKLLLELHLNQNEVIQGKLLRN